MPPSSKFHRYAIYTRQSVDRLADFSSCQAQFMTCRDFAQATGERHLRWCGRHFDDEGHSGDTLERPAMRELRQLIRSGGIDCLYVVALDRLTRRMRDAVMLLDELEIAGVELRLVYQPDLTASAQCRFLRHVLAAFAEFEHEMIAARLAESRAYLKKHGRRLAGKVPYGYDADVETKQLLPNAAEARRVRAIFDRAAKGELPSQIAQAINARGWTTKVYHAKRSGKTTGGGPWTARQVVDTLRNPVYTGRFADGVTTRDGRHDAIIDPPTFVAVQEQLDSRRTSGRQRRAEHVPFTFRQKIVCPGCGRFLTTYQITKRRRSGATIVHCYYSCRSTAGGRPRCKGVQFRVWDIEENVRAMLGETDVWRKLLGAGATGDSIRQAMEAWRTMLWLWQNEWLRTAVERIEISEDRGIISVTFADDAGAAFRPENAAFSGRMLTRRST